MPNGEDGLPPLRDVIAAHGLRADKKLGQNFILDLNLTRRMARAAAPLHHDTIIEIGPGPGGLTRALLMEGAKKIICIEADKRFLPALQEIAAAYQKNRLEIIKADALQCDIRALTVSPCRIISNLPYNIATPLLVGWLRGGFSGGDWRPHFSSLHLMVQKEVAERIVARPNTPHYGRLSVLANWLTETRALFEVNPHAFVPPPKVTSAVVEFIPRKNPLPARMETLERVTAAAFGQRRKMLRTSLKQIFLHPREQLAQVGLDETARAENIDIAAFCALACLIDTNQEERSYEESSDY